MNGVSQADPYALAVLWTRAPEAALSHETALSASTVAAVGALIHEYRELTPVLAEHLEDNEGELLPHLVMADVVRWLAGRVESNRDICRSILDWLEREYERGPEDVRGLIKVSGVEMIPDPGQPGSALRQLLGPTLRGLDPWLA